MFLVQILNFNFWGFSEKKMIILGVSRFCAGLDCFLGSFLCILGSFLKVQVQNGNIYGGC